MNDSGQAGPQLIGPKEAGRQESFDVDVQTRLIILNQQSPKVSGEGCGLWPIGFTCHSNDSQYTAKRCYWNAGVKHHRSNIRVALSWNAVIEFFKRRPEPFAQQSLIPLARRYFQPELLWIRKAGTMNPVKQEWPVLLLSIRSILLPRNGHHAEQYVSKTCPVSGFRSPVVTVADA